jgi:ADP-dependent NAD(P)H-hydrate dehydratase / NAD(P)H-hydrate epimerase
LPRPSLAYKVFTAQQVRDNEPQAAQAAGCNMYELMERAGAEAFTVLQNNWPQADKVLVLVGQGNNGGDGYVVARLAKSQGLQVTLCCANPNKTLSGDAATARQAYMNSGGLESPLQELDFRKFDLLVDALLGTGLSGQLREPYTAIIAKINQCEVPVLSIDIPSGLAADTGQWLGDAVQANCTVTFVGIKQGLCTAAGKQACGELHFAGLQIEQAFEQLAQATGQLVDFKQLASIAKRPLASHKGHFGRLLCIGGNQGMSGAIRLSAEAALRCGAGLVRVYCHPGSKLAVSNGRAELMVSSDELVEHLQWASSIVVGPGLGQDSWAQEAFGLVLSHLKDHDKPLLIDADGLTLLADFALKPKLDRLVLTPHPGEAAKLLDCTSAEIEGDRFNAARTLASRYGAVIILKGAGTIIQSEAHTWICQDGNPGMASGGMGDVLSGVTGALLAQGMDSERAALYATCIHARAADLAAHQGGERGMLASDLFVYLRQLVNV